MKIILFIITLLFSFNAFSGMSIYYIQSVTYYYGIHPDNEFKDIVIDNPDYSLFTNLKDCEQELLKAVSEPDSAVAKENDLSGDFVISRKSGTLTVHQENLVRYTKAQCVRKYINDFSKIKEEWERLNGKVE